jgi:hypothetical protein
MLSLSIGLDFGIQHVIFDAGLGVLLFNAGERGADNYASSLLHYTQRNASVLCALCSSIVNGYHARSTHDSWSPPSCETG